MRSELIKIDPDATYTDTTLAMALGINKATLWRWRKRRSLGFPKPFTPSRRPCWRGQVIIDWQNRQQQKVA